MSKSHTQDELVAAYLHALSVWEIDTGSDGEDDILIGTKGGVVADLCHHFEFEELPSHWSLSRWQPMKECCVDCSVELPRVENPLDLNVYRKEVVFVDTDGQVRCWSCSDKTNR